MTSRAWLRTLTTLAALALVVAACADEPTVSPEPTSDPTPTSMGTASPAEAASPSVTPSPSPTATDPPSDEDRTPQTFIVAPQEPREVSVGSPAGFSVGATYDESDMPERLWLGVVPCDHYDVDAQAFVSRDGTADGFDEDLGPRIHYVNGERYENVDDIWPTEVFVQEGLLTFTVLSEQEACAIPTVFDDTNGNGELDVDEQGTPLEPYGVGEATWS